MFTFFRRGERSSSVATLTKTIANLLTACSLLFSNIISVSALTENDLPVTKVLGTNVGKTNRAKSDSFIQPSPRLGERIVPANSELYTTVGAEGIHAPALLVEPLFTGWSYGCTSGPYVTCSASVTSTQTNPYRWDFDIAYTYRDNHTIFGSNFSLQLAFQTGVFYTDVPIYWNIYPVVNQDMPNRNINVQYAGVSDLNPMYYPSGSWTIPGQPTPYDKFWINFSRSTGGPEILVRTDRWHVTFATYPLTDDDSFDFGEVDCQTAAGMCGSQGSIADPINTRTGAFSLASVDLSVPTSAGELAFKRLYSSAAIDKETTLLGYGWTHNHDAKLILPTDPQGQGGYVIFKSETGNRYRFRIETNGTYSPGPGITGSLSKVNNIYTLTGIDQSKYVFNAQGRLTERTDAEGHAFAYVYDGSNRLIQVSTNSGQRYISIQYDTSGRIEGVSDHAGRDVTYGYDASSNLVSVTDILDQTWQYVYDSSHYLTNSIDPDDVQVVRNDYSVKYAPFSLNFNDFTIDKFVGEDVAPTLSATEDGGNTLHLKGNAWKSISFPSSVAPLIITPDTVLEFDFKSPVQGEIQGIGFYSSYSTSTPRIFKLYGTQTAELGHYNNYASSAPNWKHYKIRVGDFYRGNVVMLVFANDHDISSPTAESYFSNIEIYQESAETSQIGIDFSQYAITAFSNQDINPTTINVVEDNGATLHISGNSWKKIPFSYLVTLNTVIEFDFKSTTQGEIHGLGFKATEESSASQMFKLYGTESGWNSTYNNYSGSAPQWKHYKIPVGSYYQGNNLYLVFTNDHDIANPTAHSYFSNLVIYEETPLSQTWRRVTTQFNGADNLVAQLQFGLDGSSTIISDALGNQILHVYNDLGALVDETDPLGNDVDKTYDANFRPTTITDANNDTTTLTWSANGANLTRVVDAEGGQTDITYNSLNLPTSIVDPRDYLTTYTYTGVNITSTTNALNQTTTYTYTPEGYLASVTDPLNHTTSYTYDSHGQRISMADPLNNTWNYAYDSLGRLTDITDPLGHVAHNVYDAAGQLTSVAQNYDPAKTQNEDNQWNIVTTYAYDVRGNQTSVTDTLGRVTQVEYDDAGRMVKTIDPAGNETTNTYNAAGQLVSTMDALGRVTTYAYDDAGRLISTTDPLNGVSSTAYNPDGTVASTIDALGRVTSYEYDDLKRVITVTLPNGGETHNTYDESGNLTTTTDALSNVTSYEYDALNRLILTTDPLNNEAENFYNAAGQLIQTKDARGNTTTYGYDAAGRQTSVTDALGDITTYEYDALGRRTSVTDANGNATTYAYDELSRTVTVTDALGHSTTTTYDALGQTLARMDANGNSTSFAYNNLGQLTSQTDPLNYVTSFTYDDAGNRLTVTDAKLHTTTTSYDALNRPITFTDPNNNASSSTYDAAGNLSVSTDALGNQKTYAYNALNQLNLITDPLGNETSNLYNARGDLVLVTDAGGIVTKYEYDALARLTAVIENYQAGIPADSETNVRTEYTYDANGNRLTILDANGHLTTFTYDALNRLLTETDPLNHTWTYGYDDVGNRTSLTDANGATTNYVYDDANRLVTIDYASGADVIFTYDDGGRRLTMTDGLGTTTWAYNARNQVASITDPFNKTVGYSYDAVGNKTAVTYPGNSTVSYTYDPADRLTLVNGLSTAVEYTYDAANRLTNVAHPGAVNTAYTYDDGSRLLSITHAAGVELLSSFAYLYDDVGNRVQAVEDVKSPQLPPVPTFTPSITPSPTQADTSTPTITLTPSETLTPTETLTPISSPTGTETLTPTETQTPTETLEFTLTPSETPEFTFTPSETLTPSETATPSETSLPTDTATPMSSPTGTYTLIPTETMTPSETATLADTFTPTLTLTPSHTWTPTVTNTPLPQSGPVTINYIYDSLYRLEEANYSTGEFFHYTHDPVGNRLTEQTHLETNTYTYDNANRLASVNSVNYTFDNNGNLLSDGTNTYTYDAANRLISDGSITYTYNGLGDRYQQTVVSQTTTYVLDLNAGLTQVLGDGDNAYLYGLGRIAQVNTSTEYFIGDVLGSVRQLVEGGDIVFAKSYAPYGEVLSSVGSGESAFAFTGEQTDPNGLVYLRARYYSPGEGRFLTRDTWEGYLSRPTSFNRWMYGYSSPVRYTDPSGYDPNCKHPYQSFCAYLRMQEIVVAERPYGINGLIKLFNDPELYNNWGDVAGRTNKQRLAWVLTSTRGSGQGGGPDYESGIKINNLPKELVDDLLVCGVAPFQLGVDFGGDDGFSEEFRDQGFYNDPDRWDSPGHQSTQVQHFLTAVALSFPFSSFNWLGKETGLKAIIGHEKIDDRTHSESEQISATTATDIEHWQNAVAADAVGNTAIRDSELLAILNFNSSVEFGDVDPLRFGNSLQDLRLSLKGNRFYAWVEANASGNPDEAAKWLTQNLTGK